MNEEKTTIADKMAYEAICKLTRITWSECISCCSSFADEWVDEDTLYRVFEFADGSGMRIQAMKNGEDIIPVPGQDMDILEREIAT